jgi:CheY-like chemotaxis protein
VSDSGVGMDEEQLAQAFEPFFTTRAEQGGTGMGLAMVYGFVKQSGGHVSIYSEPGHGTTVRMYLPKAAHEDHTQDARSEESMSPPGVRQYTVLLVEDDDLVRSYAHEQLRLLGYRVIVAGSGADALELLQRNESVDLLFTDVVMPGGISGPQLAERAVQLRPGLKVLYTSGYTENAIVHHGRLDPGVQLLSKPYRRAELARRLAMVLAGAAD